ncbi:hypothetical protein HPP92_020332 [Vanilla planifolia]|uniref:Uncharacterized protein n=1 Tax=Vanilla planifolia TaxID=51239 RepID=A0A835PWU6_VANPL|nr:hypothetical protein HPP92_020735 [Vanilla planifolia]KAG0461856.1 hypothetical protein HPP92_020332 [Vanilla planifolia]
MAFEWLGKGSEVVINREMMVVIIDIVIGFSSISKTHCSFRGKEWKSQSVGSHNFEVERKHLFTTTPNKVVNEIPCLVPKDGKILNVDERTDYENANTRPTSN